MRKDKEQAFELRKMGKSYAEIREALRIPKSTLSDWLRDADWSKDVKVRLTEAVKEVSTARIKELGRVRGERLKRVYEEAREEAREELKTLKYNPLFIAGMMLYWGEGDRKVSHLVRLSNSDPELTHFYVEFLKKACGIPETKIRAHLLVYPDLDEESTRRFWAFATGLSLSNFSKSTHIQGRHETKRLRYGVCNIVICSTYFKVKVMEWLKLLPKELIDKSYYENIDNISGPRT